MTAETEAVAPFPKRLTIWICGLAAVCLVASIVLSIVTGDAPTTRTGADSTSASALGHSVLVELMRETGLPVTVSRHRTAQRTENASLLLLIEPVPKAAGKSEPTSPLAQMIREAKCPVLMVLPKWRGIESEEKPGTLKGAVRRPPHEVDPVLQAVDSSAKSRAPMGPERESWTTNAFALQPDIEQVQLAEGRDWTPFLRSASGFLAAWKRSGDGTIGVLADPDLVANHGLHRGDNALIVLKLIEQLRDGDGPIIVDETLHGLGLAESFWAQLFKPPLLFALLQAVLAAGLLLWSGIRRFGAPEPTPPPFGPGKAFLIDHTAGLLESGRHHGDALRRYANLTVEDALRRVHGRGGRPEDVRAWLARFAEKKHVTESLAALEAEAAELARARSADPRAALKLAGRIRRWKQEIVDGSDRRPVAR